MSETRKIYFARLVGRCIVFILGILLYIFAPAEFNIVTGMNFFRGFSVLHLLWGIWIIDMVVQLMPVKAHISIGSQKQFLKMFRPIKKKFNYKKLKQYIVFTTKSAYKVFIIWCILIGAIGVLYSRGIIDAAIMVLISIFFYMCDLICVLIWCPFRLIMKNRCCTTCRIFNWDHLMMFSPFIFVRGFFTCTLLFMSLVIWAIWELCVMLYPERFWENTNTALRCSECTDKLCTQYCHKLRTDMT